MSAGAMKKHICDKTPDLHFLNGHIGNLAEQEYGPVKGVEGNEYEVLKQKNKYVGDDDPARDGRHMSGDEAMQACKRVVSHESSGLPVRINRRCPMRPQWAFSIPLRRRGW